MSTATITAAAVIKTKQHPIVPTLNDKKFIQDLKEEFDLKNDAEAVEVIVAIATRHRWTTSQVPAMDPETNEPILDEDGQPIMEIKTIDRFEEEANRIHNGRDAARKSAKLERMKSLVAAAEAEAAAAKAKAESTEAVEA